MSVAAVAAILFVVLLFFLIRCFYRSQIVGAETALTNADAVQTRTLDEKNATIERQLAEISELAQRLRRRDEQLEEATGSTRAASRENKAVAEFHPASAIDAPQELRAHHERAATLWAQVTRHKDQFDDACVQACSCWESFVDSQAPIKTMSGMADLFAELTGVPSPKERMRATQRRLAGVASDFRGSIALLSQTLNFKLPA